MPLSVRSQTAWTEKLALAFAGFVSSYPDRCCHRPVQLPPTSEAPPFASACTASSARRSACPT